MAATHSSYIHFLITASNVPELSLIDFTGSKIGLVLNLKSITMSRGLLISLGCDLYFPLLNKQCAAKYIPRECKEAVVQANSELYLE